jgi:hypothetical protein
MMQRPGGYPLPQDIGGFRPNHIALQRDERFWGRGDAVFDILILDDRTEHVLVQEVLPDTIIQTSEGALQKLTRLISMGERRQLIL